MRSHWLNVNFPTVLFKEGGKLHQQSVLRSAAEGCSMIRLPEGRSFLIRKFVKGWAYLFRMI